MKKLKIAAAVIGLYTVQKSVGIFAPLYDEKTDNSNAFTVDIGRVLTEKETLKLDKAVSDVLGDGVYPTATHRGTHYTNASGMPYKEFRAGMKEAINKAFPGDTKVRMKRLRNGGDAVSNESWGENRHGKDYRKFLSEEAPDILRRSDAIFLPRQKEVIQKWKDRGWKDNRPEERE